MKISNSPVGLWFMVTNTNQNLLLLIPQLSVAQNKWHHYKNEKKEIHKRGKVGKRSFWKWFMLLLQLLQTLIFTIFANIVKKIFWPYLLHFSDFIKIKINWNNNLHHFQQLFFLLFPVYELNFFVFILMPRILCEESRVPI